MVDADMQVSIRFRGRDPCDFDIDHYNDQLPFAVRRNQPKYGLLVCMREFSATRQTARPG